MQSIYFGRKEKYIDIFVWGCKQGANMLLFTGDLKCFRSLTRDDDERGLTHNSGDNTNTIYTKWWFFNRWKKNTWYTWRLMLFLKQTTLSSISENSNLHFNITNCRPVGLEQQLYIKHVSGSDIRAGQQLSDGVAGEGAEEGVCGRWWWGVSSALAVTTPLCSLRGSSHSVLRGR